MSGIYAVALVALSVFLSWSKQVDEGREHGGTGQSEEDGGMVFDADNLQTVPSSPPLVPLPALAAPPPPMAASPNVKLKLWARDSKFTVVVDGRIPRDNTVLTQVSVPKDLHERLVRDSRGSLNQVLMGLVRYALEDLDAKQATLQISETSKKRR